MTGLSTLATGKGFPNVVVTGIAMTTALASDAETTWKLLLDGQSGIRALDDPFVEEFDLPVRIGGHLVEEFESQLTRIENRRLGYLQRMATVLNRRVWENAGSPEVDTNRLMVSIGTGMGSSEELVFGYDDMRERGMKAVHPLAVQMYMPNGASAAVGLQRQAKAGVITPVSACASGSEGIARAWQQIALGEADVAICGGVETRIEAVPIAAFVMKVFMPFRAFSKCVPPDPRVAFWPVSNRFASCEAKVVIVPPVRLLVRPTEQELLLPVLAVQRFWMNGNNPTWN